MRVTLNLLPPEKKAALRAGFLYAYVQTVLLIVFIVVAFASGTLVAVRFMLKGTYEDLARRSTAGADASVAVTQDIADINSYLKRLDGLQHQFTPWSQVLEQVTAAAPQGTEIDSISVDKDGNITVTGTAAVRDDVLSMLSQLRGSSLFANVQSPLSNILQQKNVSFEFDMKYVPPKAAK